MDDYAKYNEANLESGSGERPLALLTDSALDRMQNPEFSKLVGLNSDQLVDGLQVYYISSNSQGIIIQLTLAGTISSN